MKRLFLCLLAITALQVRAECMEGYFDKNGKRLDTPCSTKKQEVKCARQLAYWDGRTCVKLKQVEKCQSQGGEWYAEEKPSFCICPELQVWDGSKCRSDIPLTQQCEISSGLRVAKKFATSTNSKCIKISPENACHYQGGYWVADTLPSFCICPQQQVWDGKICRSDIPLAQQCSLENGEARVTKKFIGPRNCKPVLK